MPYAPQQNKVVEMMNRTLLDEVKCMMVGFGVSKLIWGEAVMTTTYIVNRTPCSALGGKTPEKVWSRKSPEYSHMKNFGCTLIIVMVNLSLRLKSMFS